MANRPNNSIIPRQKEDSGICRPKAGTGEQQSFDTE